MTEALLVDIEKQILQWKHYIKNLFEDQRVEIQASTEEPTRPTILKDEVKRAIETTKSGKVLGRTKYL